MRLATDIITIAHGNDAVRLRPSLRAALHLERTHGLAKLATAIAETNMAIILDIIAAATGADPLAQRIVFDRFIAAGVVGMRSICAAIDRFIIDAFGMDTDDNASTKPAGKPVSIETALTDLFEIGTGFIGWTPAETWAATPAEISAAQRGLIAKLKAIHGSADEEPSTPSADPDEWELSPDEVRNSLNNLRALSGAL